MLTKNGSRTTTTRTPEHFMSDLNDPRVLLAAERTLMAWNRTGISLMAFGFAVERFGLFMDIYAKGNLQECQRHLSFVGGLGFIALGVFVEIFSISQHRAALKSLKTSEIPAGYNHTVGMVINAVVGVMGVMLTVYLARGFF